MRRLLSFGVLPGKRSRGLVPKLEIAPGFWSRFQMDQHCRWFARLCWERVAPEQGRPPDPCWGCEQAPSSTVILGKPFCGPCAWLIGEGRNP
jgi:hypothetical protein